ncbi:MAG: glycine betaine ABC transporter substrate-binding protein [Enterobacteriaceae bacterium]
MSFLHYLWQDKEQIATLMLQHIELTLIAVAGAILLGVPLGILVSYVQRLHKPVMGMVNLIQAIPSLALLGAAIPLLGIGAVPAVLVVLLYSLLPITKNTWTGISNIDRSTIEAARGIGLTGMQVLTKVQIPLALPMIMAGVRIAAVTAVGLMTIAAFIGAGGLGFLVFSGISSVNNNLILAGAIPACILALCVDYVAARVEKRVMPEAIRPGGRAEKRAPHPLRKRAMVIASVLLVALSGYYVVTTLLASQKPKIVVAGRNFSEQAIITHLVSELIEHNTKLQVERKLNMNGSLFVFSALKKGDIDISIDYTGALYVSLLGYPPSSDVDQVYQTVKGEFQDKFNLTVLPQMAFNNTYTLSTSKQIAEQYHLRKISDLSRVADQLTGAFTIEFFNRKDGLPGVSKAYGFTLGNNQAVDGAQRYLALENGKAQVIDAFSTDGLMKKFDLVRLEDDKHLFPPYYAVLVIRSAIASRYPELVPLLEKLGPLLTEETMTELNYQVDVLQKDPQQVATDFLQQQQLI